MTLHQEIKTDLLAIQRMVYSGEDERFSSEWEELKRRLIDLANEARTLAAKRKALGKKQIKCHRCGRESPAVDWHDDTCPWCYWLNQPEDP